ncbi:general substrate transporter [Gongronella butleri]|nr:general substrate transporter [Gongronella butleri]
MSDTEAKKLAAVEAPVTYKSYLMCVFAAFGGIYFGYDSGYINGVTGMQYFIETLDGPVAKQLQAWESSLIVSILSAGTCIGAVLAGDFADYFGRRSTIIGGCCFFSIGVILQTASAGLSLLVAGRLIAGFGVGIVTAVIILYMSEIAPRKVRGAIVSGYQEFICIGLMLASCVTYGTENRTDSGSYRIPIALQLLWALILAVGLLFLPESPRYWVKKGNLDKARHALARVRDQPENSHFIESELAEIQANNEYEKRMIPSTTYFGSWANCFRGSIWKPSSNIRKTILGTSLQMMQQWTGVNFVFYYSTQFLQSTGAVSNVFLMSMVLTIINVLCTPISFYLIEKFGRRVLLVYGALGMAICEFIVAIIGVTVGFDKTHTVMIDGVATTVADNLSAVNAQVAFMGIYIFFFATSWGPGAWVLVGEIFPLPIRSRGVALSTASNWLWNCIIAVITPYLVNPDKADLKSKVFFVWGSTCFACFVYAYFLVPETKGLTLEQVDMMLEETTPRTSAKWKPHATFADQAHTDDKETVDQLEVEQAPKST